MKKGAIIAGILVLAAAGGGFYMYQNNISLFSNNAASGEAVYVTAVSSLMGMDTGIQSRYAGVVEAQDTVEVILDSGRAIKEVSVSVGDEVKQGQLLFEYDLSSIESDLQQAQLDLERLKNEALSLEEQISTLEKEKAKASQDNQLSYTIEIETNKMNLKKNEYDQKSKQAEIDKLQNMTGNTEVRSEIDGIIQKIDNSKITASSDDSVSSTLEDDSSYSSTDSSSSNAFITILSTGAYRVKGTVNELNVANVTPGSSVIIRSRADSSQTWTGIMGSIDMEAQSTESSTSSMYSVYGDSSSGSTSYPFYVEMDSSDGLMLGQHVYIELDEGQLDTKDGLWLSDYFIVDADKEDAYVWVADSNNRLRKQIVVLGSHDDSLMEYEIIDGITKDSKIAFPVESLEEGMNTIDGTGEETMSAMFEIDAEDSGLYEDTGEEVFEDTYDGDVFDEDGGQIYGEEDIDESELFIDESEFTDDVDMEGIDESDEFDEIEEIEIIEDDSFDYTEIDETMEAIQ